MTCIHEFFNPEHQKKLKYQTFQHDTFEKRLSYYRELFIDGINNLTSECNCEFIQDIGYEQNNNTIKYTDRYIKLLKDSLSEINEFFNLIINTYELFIKENYHIATQELWRIIEENELVTKISDNSIFNERPFFRGRYIDNSFDTTNPINCFHIPFNERYKVSHQRFSIAGQPMLYLGNSITAICKELEVNNPKNLMICAFLPTYKIIKSLVLLDSNIFNRFVKGDIDVSFLPTKEMIINDITRTILYEILTFPRKSEKIRNFSEEYVLPQAYTTYILSQKKWNGIVYPSSKDYSEIKNVHPYSRYNYNIALFTKYEKDALYDKDLFYQTYHDHSAIIYDNRQKTLTFNKAKKCLDILKKEQKEKQTSCINYMINYQLELFDYLKNATVNNISFFKTKLGRAELKMFKQVYDNMLVAMDYQYKNKTDIAPISKNLKYLK